MARFAPRPNALRERLNNLYFIIFTPLMTRFVLVLSVLLLLASFWDRQTLGSHWFHWAEGVVTALFVGEVVLRLAVMRSGFWESPVNVMEAVMCLFCVVVFSVLSMAHHTTRLEHNALIFLRYSSQFLRLKGIITGRGVQGSADVAMSNHMDIHQPGGAITNL